MRPIPKDIFSGSTHKTNNFGIITVIKYETARKVLVEFNNTGFRRYVSSSNIRCGKVKDPTFVPVGMEAGTAFLSDKYGEFKIIKFNNAFDVEIEFSKNWI